MLKAKRLAWSVIERGEEVRIPTRSVRGRKKRRPRMREIDIVRDTRHILCSEKQSLVLIVFLLFLIC